MTPHNNANKGDIAKIVLMPGDPLRAKFIAENYLESAICFNTVRNCLGYTGYYHNKQVSVMASGMGMPSIGIYSYELYKEYDVDTIIRIGSCGGYTKDLHIFDVILAKDAYSESTYALAQSNDDETIQKPTQALNDHIIKIADKLDQPLSAIRLHSSDVFYHEDDKAQKLAISLGCAAVEMESFALFHNAHVCHKNAACLCTISDSFVYDEITTPEQRESAFDDMIKLALESAITF